MEIKPYEQLTFDEWIKYWYDLDVAIFGEAEAKNHMMEESAKNEAMRKLWKAKEFKTVGEYEAWEKEHIAERNAFIERELNAQDR